MKKLLFTAYMLDVGGVETALVTLLNMLIEKYEITLVLEKKQGIFLQELNSKIRVIEYNPNTNKNILIRKVINLLKRIKFILKYKNKYDFAGSFATYSKMGSFCARTASRNNALWIHSNYKKVYKNNKSEIIKFFRFIKYDKFSKYIFVSEDSRENFIDVFPEKKEKTLIIKNLISYSNILKKAEEVQLEKTSQTIFLNVARHDEEAKKITRLISVSKKLKQDGIRFKVILVGEGKDTPLYKKLVKEKNLEDTVIFVGKKENPYPYFKISDAIVLTSDYEGYPVVFNEAKVLNIPIITTDVSDSKIDIQNNYGIVTNKDEESIYLAMKKFVENGYDIKNKFEPEKFNRESLGSLENLFNGGCNAKS